MHCEAAEWGPTNIFQGPLTTHFESCDLDESSGTGLRKVYGQRWAQASDDLV